jgi:hypothetical protein
MRFPVLVSLRRSARVIYFRLLPRPKEAFVLSDDLALHMDERLFAYDFFLLCAGRFFPHAVNWQLDWPKVEQRNLRRSLKLPDACRIAGDSWSLPLFFAFDCLQRRVNWPKNTLVSGAVRKCRGVRCVSVGGASQKLRAAQGLNCLCLLPRGNVNALGRRGVGLDGCIALPSSLEQCLKIWREQAQG